MSFKELSPSVLRNLVQNTNCTRVSPAHKNETLVTVCINTIKLVIIKTHLKGIFCSELFNIISKDQSFYTKPILEVNLDMVSVSGGKRQKI
jgi:hypothetical protein